MRSVRIGGLAPGSFQSVSTPIQIAFNAITELLTVSKRVFFTIFWQTPVWW